MPIQLICTIRYVGPGKRRELYVDIIVLDVSIPWCTQIRHWMVTPKHRHGHMFVTSCLPHCAHKSKKKTKRQLYLVVLMWLNARSTYPHLLCTSCSWKGNDSDVLAHFCHWGGMNVEGQPNVLSCVMGNHDQHNTNRLTFTQVKDATVVFFSFFFLFFGMFASWNC